MSKFQHVLNVYLEAIDFTDCGPDDCDRQDAPWSDQLFAAAAADVRKFLSLTDHLDLSGITWGQLGHDFWLTRNGHGAGFWDRGLGDRGDSLTAICEALGEVWTYVGDDGYLYTTEGAI